MNRQMLSHLGDLKSREIDVALDMGFAARVQLSVEEKEGERNGLVLLKRPARGWQTRIAAFADRTNLECTANKISVTDLLDPRLTSGAPLLMLTAGLVLARRLARELAPLEGPFNIIVSYDGDSCAVRFHRVRAGEAWLHAELEEYDEEGVLVLETAGGEEELALLGT